MSNTWYKITAKSGLNRATIDLLADIGAWGITAQDFKRDLDAIGPVANLDININSAGGDCFDGFAVYNLLQAHPARKVVTVLGVAASMASVIAMAGGEVVMPDNAMMMIHDPAGGVIGESDDMRKYADLLDALRDSIVGAYAKRTGLPDAKVRQLMTAETWLSAAEAVELGFADRVADPVKAVAAVDLSKFKHAPAAKAPAAKPPLTFASMAGDIYAKYNSSKPARDGASRQHEQTQTTAATADDFNALAAQAYARFNGKRG